MSKSTKIIAALGVVAGLGVAALPAFTYAASVDGDAEVIVEVTPAISLAITGNNDNSPYGHFFNSDPTGVYSAPDNTYSASVASSSKVSMAPNQIVEGQDSTSGVNGYGFLSTLTVNTNDTDGYTLNVKAASAADVDLTSGTDTIPAIATAAANFTQGTAAWGIKADADYSIPEGTQAVIKNDKWYPVSTGEQLIRPAVASSTGHANQATKIYYGVSTDDAQPTGTYQGTLTYTAATAN